MSARAATSRLKVNPPLGAPPTLEWRAVGELLIDSAYQRSIDTGPSQTLIRRIAMYWDWGLCQPLAVSRRPDGALTIVDGQHRASAAKMRGDIPHLPCVITAYGCAGDEAAAFVALNQMRRSLNALDLFKAALAAGDDTAVSITRILKNNGLSVAPHSNHTCWKPGMVSNIPGIQRCFRIYGEKITDASLEALARGFHGQVLRFAGTIFPGIPRFIAGQIKEGKVVDRSRLAEAIAMFTQQQWKTRIFEEQARANGLERPVAAMRSIASAYYALTGPTASEPTELATGAVADHLVILDRGQIGWCQQCDKKVSGERASRCTDPYCSMRQAKAA
jgi:hypothetical protein